jgi:glyoxylase-like metal-dependent hydrolase (beta-lactamase superfamily II)
MTAPRLAVLPVGPLACNCSILIDEEAREAVVVDPGDEPERIVAVLEQAGVRAVALLHTHGHFDHIGGTRGVSSATGAPIRIHEADRPLYDALAEQARFFGLRAEPPLPPGPPLEDGERIAFGRFSLRAIHTPGHTPGSTCFLLEGAQEQRLFSGDTLFHRSIGRTDLWGGDLDQILVSIRERLFTLPDDTPVVCGHNEDTTIGEEKTLNPFVGKLAGRGSL